MKPTTGTIPLSRSQAATGNKKALTKTEEHSVDKKLKHEERDDEPITSKFTEKDGLGGLSKVSSAGVSSGQGNVNVVCRFRPLNEKEKNISTGLCCEFIDQQRLNIRSSGENNLYKFAFDRIFDTASVQQQVYEYSAKSIVESVLEGFNGTILAYGQTSSGKTHTMQGVIDNLELEGIIPRMIRHMFKHILNSSTDLEFTVKVSMLEIYQEKIKDLIDVSRTNLNVREDKTKGLYIEDLSEHYVASEEEVLEIMKIGSDNRSIGATNMNENSSRSHSIFIMTIHQSNLKDLTAKTGKLYLVDLAGSEKISKTGATGLTLEEAKTINKSLATLGMVINSLTDGKSTHVPYRESKLTRVLQESLGGNSKTCLIITCSPSVYNESETLSTLRFGLRAKKIKNKPKINKEVTVAELKMEIEKLEQMLDKSDRRVSQLKNYIKNNHLILPSEEEIIKQIIEETNNEEDTEEKEKSNKQIIYVKMNNEEIEPRNTMGFGLLTEQLKHEREYNKFQFKKIENLEDDKQTLNQKLEQTIVSLNDISLEENIKEELVNKLSSIKSSYENTEKTLQNKIQELEKALEDEKLKQNNLNLINKQNEEKDKINNLNNQEQEQEEENENERMSNLSRQTNKVDENIFQHITEEAAYENYENPSTVMKTETGVLTILNELLNKIEKSAPSEVAGILREYKNKLNYETADKSVEDKIEMERLLEEEKRKYENEKRIIMKALEDKSERLGQTEVENQDLCEKLKNMESKINIDEKPNMKKLLTLERNLEQLNKMFQHAMAQKTIVTLDKESLENKIIKRNNKINLLEKELNELRDQVKARDEKISFIQIQRGTFGKALTTANNVVRIIKGGHLKQNTQMINGDLNLEKEIY